MKNKKVLFEIEGFQVFADSVYTIKDKEDLGAPSGFLEGGFTKLPSAGVDEVFQCHARKIGPNKFAWDTGFYTSSPCYSTISQDEAKIIVSKLEQTIVEPYETSIANPGALNKDNSEFWDSMFFRVFTKKVFNTAKPQEVLELYFALKTRNVVPEDKIGDRKYKNASFVVTNFAEVMEFKNVKLSLNSRATGMFEMLLMKDKPALYNILSFIGVSFSNKVHDDTLRGMFQQYLASKNGTANVSVFLEACKEIETEAGREKIAIYTQLVKLSKTSDSFKKNSNGKYYYKGEEVGPDIRGASENITTKKEFSSIKDELILNDMEE